MANSKLIIPKKIKVGFQNRSDTYTKKLAYVIYIDDKGVLRKEKSWNSWRDNKIDPQEFDNVPTPGFVLNKKVGDYRGDWGCHRQAYIRVYDPRDFEFEIDVNNLLFILEECSSIKGKGLEGDFVYAWEGTNLVLLPASSQDYQSSVKFTELQTKKLDKSELKEGHVYLDKNMTAVVYLGRHNLYSMDSCYIENDGKKVKSYRYHSHHLYKQEYVGKKTHVFELLDKSSKPYGGDYPFSIPFANIKAVYSNDVVEDYADRFEKFKKSKFGCQFVPRLKKAKSYIGNNQDYEDRERYIEIDGVLHSIYLSSEYGDRVLIFVSKGIKIDGTRLLINERHSNSQYVLQYENGKPVMKDYHYNYGGNQTQTISKNDLNNLQFQKIVWEKE